MSRLSLAEVATDRRVRIASVALEGEAARWISAVGLHEGEELIVLRRAALGGPLHVRTTSGGEFAVAREVALQIAVVIAVQVPELDGELVKVSVGR